MKRSLLALAVLGAFAGAASAQSTVTLYGRVDLSAAKNIGSKNKDIQNGSGSRLGFRGVEDLGGGLQAFFNIEHRFNADTGTVTGESSAVNSNPATATPGQTPFWRGRSVVGLQGGFGRLTLGRDYGAAALAVELAADPWGWDTIANQATITTGGVLDWIWINNAVTYNASFGGFAFAAQVAEAQDNFAQQKRPTAFALSYGAGPIYAALGISNQAGQNDRWNTGLIQYDLGFFKPGFFFGSGKNNLNQKIQSYMLTATAPIGGGEFRASYGQLKNKDVPPGVDGVLSKRLALGYHYALSKRTTIYTDYANEKKVPTQKNGYDVGIKHNF